MKAKLKTMEVMVDNCRKDELHEVIYIEYRDGLPFEVITRKWIEFDGGEHWIYQYWDGFYHGGDKESLYLYNNGCGPSKAIELTKYDDGAGITYWAEKHIELKGDMQIHNRLKRPKLVGSIDKSRNPFRVGYIATSMEYCPRCEECYADEHCTEHLYEDDNGDLRCIDDDRLVD